MMSVPITRSSATPSDDPRFTLSQAVVEEIELLRTSGELGDCYRTEPRCHICCQAESKDLVNKLIAANLTNREIAEACAGINARRIEADDDRLIDARKVWSHKRNHFNIDEPAQAVYRKISERRAEEMQKDHINGMGHIVTPYAVMEVGMVKGYEQMMDPTAKFTAKETLDFAKALHDYTSRDAGQQKMADLMFQMHRIIEAAQKWVPVEDHEAFIAEVEGTPLESKPMQALVERVNKKAEQVIKDFTPRIEMDERDMI